MWEKPNHQTATATARPMRVAYLVEVTDCPDELLDAIFAESYSRWGGRRTLIVPATVEGIDDRYETWLTYFDADIIYSFVALSDSVVAAIHERYAPAYLTYHEDRGVKRGKARSYRIELPYRGLSSLSILPAFGSRRWGFDGKPTNVTVLDKAWYRNKSQFLEENFGFLSSSFQSGAMARSFPDQFACLTLISAEALADRHLGKDENAEYETNEDKILEAFDQKRWLLPLVNLSNMFSPYLDSDHDTGNSGMNIVAGDTAADRLLFWNGHHNFARPMSSELTSLRIPSDRLEDDAFLKRIRDIIQRRGVRGHDGRNDGITLCSCSLDREALEAAAERLRKCGNWLSVRVEQSVDHARCIPKFRGDREDFFTLGGIFNEPEGRASCEFRGNRVDVPRAMPWHMSETLPPTGLRHGNWMLDLTVERLIDHCRYVNERHVWALPRRLRLETAFKLEREPDDLRDRNENFIRPMRTGKLGLAQKVDLQTSVVTIPEDLDAIGLAICNNFEWLPFDQDRKDAPRGCQRFYHAELSDKGRYLLGVFQLFESFPVALSVLLNGFWRDVLHHLGASPVDKNPELPARLITTLRRRLKQPVGALILETDEQEQRLAREALRIARNFRKEQRYIRYSDLKERWRKIVEKYLSKNPGTEDDDDEIYYRDERQIELSVQYLCQCEVLYQGREWRCQTCFNRNWVGIDVLGRNLTCEICGRNEPAPVSGDWHFRANAFVLEAYSEHGTEALVWALSQLAERARKSFYFAPSLKLWFTRPESDDQQCDVEIDAVAVVDGRVYAVEATTSIGLANDEIERLAIAAERIRPDVMFVACMAETKEAVSALDECLRMKLPKGVRSEVVAFHPDSLERVPFLPY